MWKQTQITLQSLLVAGVLTAGGAAAAPAGTQEDTATDRVEDDWQPENQENWPKPTFNRYAVDYGYYDDFDDIGYHYEEEDEFGWYDPDFAWSTRDGGQGYEGWYGDADEDWDWF